MCSIKHKGALVTCVFFNSIFKSVVSKTLVAFFISGMSEMRSVNKLASDKNGHNHMTP